MILVLKILVPWSPGMKGGGGGLKGRKEEGKKIKKLYTAKRKNMVLYNCTGSSEIQPDPVANVPYRIF